MYKPIDDNDMPDVMMVNRSDRIALLEDNTVLTITDFLDADGDKCDAEDAVSCVAQGLDVWWFIDLTEFENQAVH